MSVHLSERNPKEIVPLFKADIEAKIVETPLSFVINMEVIN